jgi:hypothetical protein
VNLLSHQQYSKIAPRFAHVSTACVYLLLYACRVSGQEGDDHISGLPDCPGTTLTDTSTTTSTETDTITTTVYETAKDTIQRYLVARSISDDSTTGLTSTIFTSLDQTPSPTGLISTIVTSLDQTSSPTLAPGTTDTETTDTATYNALPADFTSTTTTSIVRTSRLITTTITLPPIPRPSNNGGSGQAPSNNSGSGQALSNNSGSG